MAAIAVLGSVARDEVVRLQERVREGCHLQGAAPVSRLGGGGANSAVALAHAGEHVHLVTAVGDDLLADHLVAELAAVGVDTGLIIRVPGPSTRSILLVDPAGERTIVNLTRASEPGPPERLLQLACDCVYVRTRTAGMAPLLARLSCPVVAHVPPLEEGALPAEVLVGSASDLPPEVLADPLAMGRRVAGGRLRWVVVTRGPAGAEAYGGGGERITVPAPPVAAVDSTGAGDTFAAGLVRALAHRREMADALREAVRWGAAKVACDGSALTREAVLRLL